MRYEEFGFEDEDDDDIEFIADVPVAPTVKVLRDVPEEIEEWHEAERLGLQRLWQVLQGTIVGDIPDDFYPPMTSYRVDKFGDRGL